jgi:hypothetical protein
MDLVGLVHSSNLLENLGLIFQSNILIQTTQFSEKYRIVTYDSV